jgi:hypothetical protein
MTEHIFHIRVRAFVGRKVAFNEFQKGAAILAFTEPVPNFFGDACNIGDQRLSLTVSHRDRTARAQEKAQRLLVV